MKLTGILCAMTAGLLLSAAAANAALTSKSEPALNDADTLFFAASTEPYGLDPVVADDIDSGLVMCNIYEGLLRMRPYDVQVEPCLAESYEISDDLKTYTFRLRKNVRFHDGTPFTSEAVKINFDRQTGANLLPSMTKSAVVFGDVERVETPDQYTVRFILKRPSTPFIYNIARNFAAPIASPTAIKNGVNLMENPVGTGPYRFVRWDKGKQVILTANTDYWGEQPHIKNISYKVLKETFSRALALISGEVDAISGIDLTIIDELKQNSAKIITKTGNNTNYMAFNFASDSKTANLEVRQAVAASINLPELVSYLYKEYATPAYSYLSELILGHTTSLVYSRYDPQHAREIFKKHNVKKLKIITYDDSRIYNPVGGYMLADAVQFYLEEAGIDSVIEVYEWSEFKKRLQSDQWDIAFTGWVGDTGGGVNFFSPLLSQNPMVNIGGWKSEKFLKLIDKAQVLPVGEERNAVLAAADRVAAEELPILPLSHTKTLIATNNRVSGNFVHPVGFTFFSRAEKIPQSDGE